MQRTIQKTLQSLTSGDFSTLWPAPTRLGPRPLRPRLRAERPSPKSPVQRRPSLLRAWARTMVKIRPTRNRAWPSELAAPCPTRAAPMGPSEPTWRPCRCTRRRGSASSTNSSLSRISRRRCIVSYLRFLVCVHVTVCGNVSVDSEFCLFFEFWYLCSFSSMHVWLG